jgi:hypothetical protein
MARVSQIKIGKANPFLDNILALGSSFDNGVLCIQRCHHCEGEAECDCEADCFSASI